VVTTTSVDASDVEAVAWQNRLVDMARNFIFAVAQIWGNKVMIFDASGLSAREYLTTRGGGHCALAMMLSAFACNLGFLSVARGF
jgi:hypothetical protein